MLRGCIFLAKSLPLCPIQVGRLQKLTFPFGWLSDRYLLCSPDLHDVCDSSASAFQVSGFQVCATTLGFRISVQFMKPVPRRVCISCLLLCPWVNTGTQKKEGLDAERQLFYTLAQTLIPHHPIRKVYTCMHRHKKTFEVSGVTF